MKIPGIDTLVYTSTMMLSRLGYFKISKDLEKYNATPPEGIVIALTTALGDSIAFTPVLSALREKYSETKIVGFIHHAFAPLYENDPRFDRIVPYHGKYKHIRKTIQDLKIDGCELALLPYINDPDVIPLVLMGGSTTLFRMPGRNTIYNKLVVLPELLSSVETDDHAHIRVGNMVKHLGCTVINTHANLYSPADSLDWINKLYQERNISNASHVIGIHPGASIPEKQWPASSYAGLAKKILGAYPTAAIVLTGSPDERPLCEEIRESVSSDSIVNIAGDVPIQYMPEVLKSLSVLVSGDTGIAHMAYAVECRTVTMFWHSRPDLSGPIEEGINHIVVQKNRAEEITPEFVFSITDNQINKALGKT